MNYIHIQFISHQGFQVLLCVLCGIGTPPFFLPFLQNGVGGGMKDILIISYALQLSWMTNPSRMEFNFSRRELLIGEQGHYSYQAKLQQGTLYSFRVNTT